MPSREGEKMVQLWVDDANTDSNLCVVLQMRSKLQMLGVEIVWKDIENVVGMSIKVAIFCVVHERGLSHTRSQYSLEIC